MHDGRPLPGSFNSGHATLPWPRKELFPLFNWMVPRGWAHPDSSFAFEYLGAFFWGPERLQALGLAGLPHLDSLCHKYAETEEGQTGEEDLCDAEEGVLV